MPIGTMFSTRLLLVLAVAGATGCSSVEKASLPIHEDFSDPAACRWPVKDDDSVTLSCSGGAYRFAVKDPEYIQTSDLALGGSVDTVRMAADAAHESGDADEDGFGLGCWHDADRAYLFALWTDGTYAIAKMTPDRERFRDGLLTRGVARERAAANPGQPIRMTIRCEARDDESSTLTLEVAGERVATVDDRDGLGEFSGVGFVVLAESDLAEVVFDEVAVDDGSPPAEPEADSEDGGAPETETGADTGAPDRVLLSDDFNVRRPRWPVEETREAKIGYLGDGYRMRIERNADGTYIAQPLGETVPRVSVSIEVKERTATDVGPKYGVSCDGGSSSYFFSVSSSRGTVAIVGIVGDTGSALYDAPSDAIRRPPAANEIRAVCEAVPDERPRITLFVNGVRVASVRGVEPLDGFDRVSLGVDDGGADVVFDNLVVRGG